MRSFSKSTLIGVSAVVLVGLLFLLPRHKKGDKVADIPVTNSFSIDQFEQQAKLSLDTTQLHQIDALNSLKEPERFDSLAAFWDRISVPGLAAKYMELLAKGTPTEKSYINAAYRYFDAWKQAQDSLSRDYFVGKAIASYSEVLKINPENLNAKTDLGICYAEGTNNPMQGITMLKEVVEKDPNHENALLNLGFLSVKSGQFDKALERFNKVLQINPSRIDMYVFIGQTYVQMGNNNEAIKSFETYKSLSNNTKAIAEIDSYIKELQTKAVK